MCTCLQEYWACSLQRCGMPGVWQVRTRHVAGPEKRSDLESRDSKSEGPKWQGSTEASCMAGKVK